MKASESLVLCSSSSCKVCCDFESSEKGCELHLLSVNFWLVTNLFGSTQRESVSDALVHSKYHPHLLTRSCQGDPASRF
jgi:hypothetical protein